MALLLAFPASGGAEVSWLDAEVRAQEARWAAQRDRAARRPSGDTRAGVAPPRRRDSARPAGPRATSRSFPPVAARTTPVPPTPTGWTVPPVPARARPAASGDAPGIAGAILASARQHGLDPLLVKAVILAESANRRWAISPKGAMGLMQLMPATARRFGVTDPYDPAQNIAGGARYLRWLLDRFRGDVTRALAGYNAGEGKVDRYGGIPPYRETRNYVRIVQSNHRLLRQRVAERVAGKAR